MIFKLLETKFLSQKRRRSSFWGAAPPIETSAPLQPRGNYQYLIINGGKLERHAKRGRREEVLRREEPALTSEHSHIYVITAGDFMHAHGQSVVKVRGKSIEFLWLIQGNDGDLAAILNGNSFFYRHDGRGRLDAVN